MSTLETKLLSRSKRESNGCLVWQGATNGKAGYGKMFDGIKSEYVHRIAYRVFIGDIPEGFTIDHVAQRGCTSRKCIEPEHLEAVTITENHARRLRPTHCKKGHEYNETTTYWQKRTDVSSKPSIACRVCHAEREKNRRQKMKGRNHVVMD
jgi:hypothetical protein